MILADDETKQFFGPRKMIIRGGCRFWCEVVSGQVL